MDESEETEKQIVKVNFGADTPEPRTESRTWKHSQIQLQQTELALELGIKELIPYHKKGQMYEVMAESLPDGDAEVTEKG